MRREAQRVQYEDFVTKQEKEKDEKERKAARAKAEYDQAKEKVPHLVKNYDPPIKIKDPYLRRMALDAQAKYQEVTTLGHTQLEDKLRFLEKLDREREKQAETGKESDRAGGERSDSALTRAFEKAKAQQEQTRQRTQSQDHDRNRERDRS